jgi:hypothetical protein
MNSSRDDEVIVAAVRKAQDILARYIAPGGPSAPEAIDQLLAVLDDEELTEALAHKGGPGKPDLRTV